MTMLPWIRARFTTQDDRPARWPPPGPSWCTGYTGESTYVVVAYVRLVAEITDYWPDATGVESQTVRSIEFSDRFARPPWWTDLHDTLTRPPQHGRQLSVPLAVAAISSAQQCKDVLAWLDREQKARKKANDWAGHRYAKQVRAMIERRKGEIRRRDYLDDMCSLEGHST